MAASEINTVFLRPRVEGKFLVVNNEKFYIRGVTYGTFRPNEQGEEYSLNKVKQDFQQIAANGFNSIRTYTVPPRWLLDVAEEHGLYVMVGLPWEQHVTFLDDESRVQSIKERVRFGVQSCAGHPAVLCYTIGNEIPSPIVRWYGARKIERFLNELYKIAKKVDPEGLVTYVNYPSTEYLQLAFVDFLSFNVYLETEERLSSYVARLQNIAGETPLVLAEIGLDSRRNGEEKQAEMLDWQIRTAFRGGCAGAFIFSWTDEWYRGGFEIEDWDFGLTTRERQPKAALATVSRAFAESPFPPDDVSLPYISVVICTYNGGRTIRDCMEGLTKLDYPNFEVIVVDDGSKDNTAEIVSEYPFRLIQTENRGLGSARNTGLEAAKGEIIAYTDDDARPDPHWLHYLAMTYSTTNHAAVGGPNIAPAGDGWIAECVANAPGGPVHVLLDDETAEHIPGCNCSFRTENLRRVGGWDERYRTAGDDVDVCWRIQHMGWTIGYNPAAMVWHHRRNSIKDYWNQQIGYGKAESLLEEKYPEKYNATGHLSWDGQLYGKGLTQALISLNERIYQGRWGRAPFQSVYQTAPNKWWSLPLMPEWYLIIGLLVILTLLGLLWQPLFRISFILLVLSVGAVLSQAVISAAKASFTGPPKTEAELLKAYTITAFLHILQPLARLKGRIRYGLTPWRRRGNPGMVFPRQYTKSVWSETWREPDEVLESLHNFLKNDGAVIQCGGDFDHWDLDVRGGIMASARVLMTVEEHGGGKQLFRFKAYPRISRKWVLLALLLSILAINAGSEYPEAGAGVLVVFGFLIVLALYLSALIYNECANPLAAILSAIESLKQEPGIQTQTTTDVVMVKNEETGIAAETNFDDRGNSQNVAGKSRAASAGDGEKKGGTVKINRT
ncbi:MAG TPA: glycosyltransferase [Pyrinomonadaceae bacterium]|jgi:glycosyltransferase involved in cell wall biosynthesis